MTEKKCCGLDRREFLRATLGSGVSLGFMGAGLPALLGARAARAGVTPDGALYDAALSIFMDGGPSQTDTLDPKPGTPHQGAFGAVSLGYRDVYGQDVKLGDRLAGLANLVTDPASNVRLGLIRSFSHQNEDHGLAQNYMNTWWGSVPASNEYPSMASAMAHYYQGQGLGVPSVVITPEKTIASSTPNTSRCPAALMVAPGDPQGQNPVVQALRRPAGVDAARYDRRRAFAAAMNARFLASRPDEVAKAWDRASDDAHKVTQGGQAAQAFDLTGVPLLPAADQDTARRLTLAKRLLTAGVPFVATGILGNDSHDNNSQIVAANWGQSVGQGVSQLCRDLAATGKRVLVVIYGDFGRTPFTVDPNGQNRNGRDHWADGFSVGLLSINQPKFTPTAIGDTGPLGMWTRAAGTLKDPVQPKDLGGFIYRSLGFQLGRADGAFDVPMADRDAPPVDRLNDSSKLLRTFGLA